MFLPQNSPTPRTAPTLAADAPDVRVVGCDACGTEGRIYRSRYGGNDPDTIDTGPCPWCEGIGSEVIEVQPIEMDDLPPPSVADELDDEATRIDLDECDWSGKAWKLREEAAEMRRKSVVVATCHYPDCDGGPATGYCHVDCPLRGCADELDGGWWASSCVDFSALQAGLENRHAAQLSDAVLASVLNWDDALGLAYRLSPHYETHPEKECLAVAIWRRAQERHQLDKDERS